MVTPLIKTATESDIEPIVSSLVLAFSTDPAVRWMYPSPQEYLKNYPQLVRVFGAKAFEYKTVYYIGGYAGAAVWFPPQSKLDMDAMGAFLQQTISQQRQEEVFAVLEQIESYHPHEPYWYLAILGVEANQQHKGYGSALMRHKLQECDKTNTIAYLESSNPNNIPFYEGHGFKVIGEIQAGESPTIFPMSRHPSQELSATFT
ncbi:MAG: GNAT family N-acetyltransferase [Calothrix sp. MO_192.B10]|nr:GNAT family N-acetyltransferase [Calothrix sp. MO_192.B10]